MPDTPLRHPDLRTRRIVLLLGAVLLVVLALATHAWRSEAARAATRTQALAEFAELTGEEFGRRATAEIGYRALYPLITRLRAAASIAGACAELRAVSELAPALDVVDRCFALTETERFVEGASGPAGLDALLSRELEASLDDADPYAARRTADGGVLVVLARRPTADGATAVLGFTVSRAALRERMARVVARRSLLPAALGDGRIGNDRLVLRVRAPDGGELLAHGAAVDAPPMARVVLGDDYQGVLEGVEVDVTLDADAAALLLAGGGPTTGLPVVLGLLVLVIALLGAALWLWQREREVLRLREAFVAEVTHELRTPLAQIRLFAETLLLDRARTGEERERALRIIDREARRLGDLVESVLRFGGLADAARVSTRALPLAPILEEAREAVADVDAQARIEAELDAEARAEVDAGALRQVVVNLLDNALKYGPASQRVGLVLKRDGDQARIEVEDEGPGIPTEERARLWLPFQRLERETTAAIAGTGLGLAVVRGLVEAMAGRCWFEDGGAGLRVCVTLPLANDRG